MVTADHEIFAHFFSLFISDKTIRVLVKHFRAILLLFTITTICLFIHYHIVRPVHTTTTTTKLWKYKTTINRHTDNASTTITQCSLGYCLLQHSL